MIKKTNNVTVTQFNQQSLSEFFLPSPIPSEKFLEFFVSDAASYMIKVGTP